MQQQATKLNPGQQPTSMTLRAWHARRRQTGQTNPYHNPATDDRCTACAIIRWGIVGLIIWAALLALTFAPSADVSDQRYLQRIQQIITHWQLPITVWTTPTSTTQPDTP